MCCDAAAAAAVMLCSWRAGALVLIDKAATVPEGHPCAIH